MAGERGGSLHFSPLSPSTKKENAMENDMEITDIAENDEFLDNLDDKEEPLNIGHEPDDELADGEAVSETITEGRSKLMMHMKGSRMYHNDSVLSKVELSEFIPDSDTYVPVTHSELVEEVKFNVRRFFDVPISEEHYALSATNTKEDGLRIGARMFGLLIMDLKTGDEDDDFTLCIGVKNALDGSTRAAVCVGHQVFVCDNLSFTGELMTAHRHTKNIHTMLPGMILNTIKQGPDQFFRDQHLKKELKDIRLKENQGYKVLCDMAVNNVLKTTGGSKSQFVQAVKQHRNPQFGVFADNTAWSLLNAVTFGIQQHTNPAGIMHSSHGAVNYFREFIQRVA